MGDLLTSAATTAGAEGRCALARAAQPAWAARSITERAQVMEATARLLADIGVGVCVGQEEPRSRVAAGLARVLDDEKIAESARSESDALRPYLPERALEKAIDACCLAAATSRGAPPLARRH